MKKAVKDGETDDELIGLIDDDKDHSNKENDKLDIFGVDSPWNLTTGNFLFCYSSQLESRCYCSDMVFKTFTSMCFNNCAIHLIKLLFTCVDLTVREQFITELVCSVYYANFEASVRNISPNISLFSKADFVREVIDNLNFGIVFGLDNFSNMQNNSYTYNTELKNLLLNLVAEVKLLRGKLSCIKNI